MVEIVYTNKNCSDVFIPFYKQNRKYSKYPLKVISDYIPKVDSNVEIYTYENSDPYYVVWTEALKKFKSDYFIYLQEDFFLYSNVDTEKLNEYRKILETTDYSFVRLLKSGQLNNKMIYKNIYEIESTNVNIFSMQATIWKTADFIKIMNSVKENKWLENDNYRNKIIELKLKGLYNYNGEPKRGSNHYDSITYPYIATAVVRGKWNYKEYKKELEPILLENKIDIKHRGLF